jgi:2-oxoglutarate dehydrogenase E1 component
MSLDAFGFSVFENIPHLEQMYERYLQNPNNVDNSWRKAFEKIDNYCSKPLADASSHLIDRAQLDIPLFIQDLIGKNAPPDLRIDHLIQAYRTYGYLTADINPIATHPIEIPRQLQLKSLGFSEDELSKRFPTLGLLEEKEASLQEIIDVLKEIYCGHIGIEYFGIQDPSLEQWLEQHVEPSRSKIHLSIDQKKLILQHLNKSELFESFLHTKYVGQKRFSLEGGETLIPILAAIIDIGSQQGAEEFVLGMAHRGRLNVLANILEKSYSQIFSEFEEGYIPFSFEGSGDVKYHKGFSSLIQTASGKTVKVDLSPNPSHLESVNSVVEGMVYAKQLQRGDIQKEKVIPVLIHGDAAISGQGVVYETMQLCKLPGYDTGGTIHIIINNQIGFTTLPKDARSTFYCSDIAQTFEAPVFHVNVESPEACVFATILAVEMRQKFHCDVMIDLNCYRKYGHNEGDEPAFTQPLQYQLIRKKKPIREIYRDDLLRQGVLEQQIVESLEHDFKEALQKAHSISKASEETFLTKREPSKPNIFELIHTAVPKETLRTLAKKFCSIPEDLMIHPKIAKLAQERLEMVLDGKDPRPIDWGMGETLAYASLLGEGIHVRLSGQDSCRGTFSHRHALWMDQMLEKAYFPLNHLDDNQGKFTVYNSPLSEYAVLGFEFGYSSAYSKALVIWEAQFGDFCNAAQVIIDQYISTAEQKWGLKEGVVLFLPHAYEGQGPEHSSGRMERFLTLCGNNNMVVANPTLPAQLFHILRRQVLKPMLKPLIVFTPKGLLRHPECVNCLDDFAQGNFKEIMDDPTPPVKAKKLVFCSGHIFYDLIQERRNRSEQNMAIIRVEQLYPLHREVIKEMLHKYRGFSKCIWAQEEPRNMGAWHFIKSEIQSLLPKGKDFEYIGRAQSASPAVGSYALHKKEYAKFIKELFEETK